MRHLRKRSLRLAGHATSIALEPIFWAVLEGEAARRGATLAALIAEQDALRAETGEPLASRLRVFAVSTVTAVHGMDGSDGPA
ncbi:ribbon-helix-helix domain-containing protein [Sediminicoccus sp. KRV36]|uniref:ribbon-helix-helix domain-containing protein n=1 Tax=Sediminicoccus sp. KRV36 TaxID=3133721 RepID=UPI00200D6A95|nr:ribbon-helix-helix domain-containing protein [Sediminicoccus rosea]UPY35155.1 ribbon-helix-helix domain-containing protein [Sediminicoccus rosea]